MVVSKLSVWTPAVFCYSLLWAIVSTQSPEVLPAPLLTQLPSKRDGQLVMLCRAPEGQTGDVFRLFSAQKRGGNLSHEMINNATLKTQEPQFKFEVMSSWTQLEILYLCQYMNQQIYSHFSVYLSMEQPEFLVPPPLPSPFLSVEPPSGQVKWGQNLYFRCSLPPVRSNAQHVAFLLLKNTGGTFMVVSQAGQVHLSLSEPGVFHIGPITGGEGGSYTCLYQVTHGQMRTVNSTSSDSIWITVTGMDWPLMLGSFSAVVLFSLALTLVAIVSHKKVKAAAADKRKRDEAKFWTEVHGKDHIIDLTLKRGSINLQEWESEAASPESIYTSPRWQSLSTFGNSAH